MKKFFAGMLMLFSQFLCSQNKSDSIYQTYAIHNNLPLFYSTVEEGLNYPFSWYSGNFTDFDTWHTSVRAKVVECLLKSPSSSPFSPVVIGEQDRGSYVARKIVFNITAESRVLGYFLYEKAKARSLLSCSYMIMVQSLILEKKKSSSRLMILQND